MIIEEHSDQDPVERTYCRHFAMAILPVGTDNGGIDSFFVQHL